MDLAFQEGFKYSPEIKSWVSEKLSTESKSERILEMIADAEKICQETEERKRAFLKSKYSEEERKEFTDVLEKMLLEILVKSDEEYGEWLKKKRTDWKL